MQALGLIETRGLLAAILGADAMLKAAEVTLVEKTYVGGGLVSITIKGDVAAVKAAVEAGAALIKDKKDTLLISEHIIPRPHTELAEMIGYVKPAVGPQATGEMEEVKEAEVAITTPPEANISLGVSPEELTRGLLDTIALEQGLAKALELLNGVRVTKLRNLAREYKDLGIAGRLISKADKKLLLTKFKEYYEKTGGSSNN